MPSEFKNILVVQTAFIGDVILTLPLVQLIKKNFPETSVDIVVVSRASGLFSNHPSIRNVIPYDKRGRDKGIRGFRRIQRTLESNRYDLAVVPHRSLRSALLVRMAGIPRRVGFSTSAGRWLLTDRVQYRSGIHEIERNISLLSALGFNVTGHELPRVYPSDADRDAVERLFQGLSMDPSAPMVGVAPGTIWNTKRWPKERFAEVVRRLGSEGFEVLLVGGDEDTDLCQEIKVLADSTRVRNVAGKFTLLQSAEALRRCKVLLTNDSAPMHLGVAVQTPVVALFGATVPEFGFAPYGAKDIVLETKGLSCRPCSIHGGNKCPIGTFECMLRITPESVLSTIHSFL
ncbi:MAG: lipopolysaccharide heptosyltransferase II [Bacteroidota bacterium]